MQLSAGCEKYALKTGFNWLMETTTGVIFSLIPDHFRSCMLELCIREFYLPFSTFFKISKYMEPDKITLKHYSLNQVVSTQGP